MTNGDDTILHRDPAPPQGRPAVNPFKHPLLLVGLAKARDDAGSHAVELLICADYAEDQGDAALAAGLRAMLVNQIRPAHDARRNSWRWERGWEAREDEPFLAGQVPGRCWRLHPALYAALDGHLYETWGNYQLPPPTREEAALEGPSTRTVAKHYSSFALAVIHLARLLAEPRQAALPL
jgi:hypothetical protein